tara:strand:+ start:1873 stop:2214 length:342 start_codon:yes stop_codon:yes gene_type:complete
MKPIDKLRELLCTVPEISDNIRQNDISVMIGNDEDGKPVFEDISTIQERHLRMYCNSRSDNLGGNYISINQDGDIECVEDYNTTYCIITLDNKKDFQDQSDEVIESIVEFLEN